MSNGPSTWTIASSRAAAHAAACIASTSPPNARVTRWLIIEEHVEREIDAGRPRDRANRVVDGVALDHTPRRARIPDPACVVEREGR